MSLPPLRDWQVGDSNRDRAHFQQAVDALREIDRRAGAGEPGNLVQTRARVLVKIVEAGPGGESDYDDARYWVTEQLIEGANHQAALTFSEDTTKAAFEGEAPNTHTGTNVGEWATDGGTHSLKTDGTVFVFAEEWTDRGSPNRRHYLFSRPAPKGGAVVCVLATAAGGNGTQTAAPTYTYNATDVITGESLGSALTPEVSRPFGTVTAATRGLGYFDADGIFVLTVAFETPGSGACPDE